ncbi:conserved domain protein [Trichinella spiralis]|uniref:hypothetical protein n=1 Tax=Trichinella spiralis TaxID=6334 RepID=UPI0001EFD90D|nr:conserved domain protein [Trichinella spiralis]
MIDAESMRFSNLTVIIRNRFKEWSKENVKTRTTRNRTREGNRYDFIFRAASETFDKRRRVLTVRLELIPRPENFPINSNRFLSLQYANEDRLKIALSSISNGALVCFTCVASNSILKRQTFALNMINEEKKK